MLSFTHEMLVFHSVLRSSSLPAGFFDSDIKSPPSLNDRKPATSGSVDDTNSVSSSLPAGVFGNHLLFIFIRLGPRLLQRLILF